MGLIADHGRLAMIEGRTLKILQSFMPRPVSFRKACDVEFQRSIGSSPDVMIFGSKGFFLPGRFYMNTRKGD
jgi:hypothetical protein